VNTDCERVRIALMAQVDEERLAPDAPDRTHLLTCESCQRWVLDFRSMSGQLQALPYPRASVDLWAAVNDRIRQPENGLALPRRLWPIAGGMLAWRALQLFVDLPIPVLHPIVPLAATVAAFWMLAGDPLRIETSAPELRKRGA
jgi:hypothetical protein